MINRSQDLKIARSFKKELKSKLGDNLISVYFYGSRAKGTAKKDSDFDLFLLMKKRPKLNSRTDKLLIEVVDWYLNKKNIYISAIPYGLDEYSQWKNYSPILHWISKEGIKL